MTPRLLFANRDFRRLWLVGTLASMVRWLDTLAFAIFAYQHGSSAFTIAMLSMLRMLPMGLCGPFISAFADRVQRRTIFVATASLNLTAAATLAILAGTGHLAVWHLAAAAFVNGISWTAENTTRRVNIGELVGSDALPQATSFDAASANAARMLGPTAGGIFIASVGITAAFIFGAALYAISLLTMLGYRYQHTSVLTQGQSIFGRIAEGFTLVSRHPKLIATLVITIIFNLFAWPVTSMVPVIAQGKLNLGAETTGLLVSLDGTGALLASLAIGWLATPRRHAAIYITSVASYCTASIALALSPAVPPAAIAIFISGAASAGFGIMQTTITYLASPPDLRSRAFGVLALCIGIAPIGFIHLGYLANLTSSPTATLIVATEGLISLVATWRWWRVLVLG